MRTRLALVWLMGMIVGVAGARGEEVGTWDGVWVVKRAMVGERSMAGRAWGSMIKVEKGRFQVTNFQATTQTLKGKFGVDDAKPGEVVVETEEVDLSERWEGVKVPAARMAGIYRFEREEGEEVLKVALRMGEGERPKDLAVKANDVMVMTLVRALPGVAEKGFPEKVRVMVEDAEGKPAAGARLLLFMQHWREGREGGGKWEYQELAKTGADGSVTVGFKDLRSRPAVVLAADGKGMGLSLATAGVLQRGEVKVVLRPVCHVKGRMESEELAKAGRPLGWTNTYLSWEGEQFGMCEGEEGVFDYDLPAGRYVINAYGSDVVGRYVTLEVPAGETSYEMPGVEMKATALGLLKGKPAPEFQEVLGWKGEPVTLAALKGKVVLVDFWGYWCNPCVEDMPTLMAVYEKYKEKGLAVVGVHVDLGFDSIDTAAKLDARLEKIREKSWKGKDVPFPVALTSGRTDEEGVRQGVAAQYGITGYPTTIVIDREGKVAGVFAASDEKQAGEEVEKLLKEK